MRRPPPAGDQGIYARGRWRPGTYDCIPFAFSRKSFFPCNGNSPAAFWRGCVGHFRSPTSFRPFRSLMSHRCVAASGGHATPSTNSECYVRVRVCGMRARVVACVTRG